MNTIYRRLTVLIAVATATVAMSPAQAANGVIWNDVVTQECLAPIPVRIDNFMDIHMANQKIDSAVSFYWRLQTAAWS